MKTSKSGGAQGSVMMMNAAFKQEKGTPGLFWAAFEKAAGQVYRMYILYIRIPAAHSRTNPCCSYTDLAAGQPKLSAELKDLLQVLLLENLAVVLWIP